MKKIKLLAIAALGIFAAACTTSNEPVVIKFESTPITSIKVNTEYTYNVVVSAQNAKGTIAITATGLPTGITLTNNGDGTAVVTGTPTTLGNYDVVLTASNNGFSKTQPFTLKVTDSSVISGDGSEANPYSASQAITNNTGSGKWVKGYIVGYAWSLSASTGYFFTADTCTQATNVLLADSPAETDKANILTVQLPSGAVRNGINLKDNKANLGQMVTLYGDLMAYFSVPGIKNVSYAELGDKTFGTKPIDTSKAIFSETFATGIGAFTIYDVVKPASMTNSWIWDTYKYMKCSGYVNGASVASESWLISPAFDLSGKTSGSVYFEHAIGPNAVISIDKKYFKAYISTNYNTGNPNDVAWSELAITSFSTAGWGFVTANIAIPEGNFAANARIAFKYSSSDTESATWEVKNVMVNAQ